MASRLVSRLYRARATGDDEGSVYIDFGNWGESDGITVVPWDSLSKGAGFVTADSCMKLSAKNNSIRNK